MKKFITNLFGILIFGVLFFLIHSPSFAASNGAKISFTFDDGYLSTLNAAEPVLAKYGIDGTVYIPTGCINNTGACRNNVNPTASYMTWAQVKSLQDSYGWEVGAHTVNHRRLSELTNAQKETELSQSKQDLVNHGLRVTNLASPEGDYDYATLAIASKYYTSHRGFWDRNKNTFPYNDSILQVMQVQEPVTVAQVQAAIDTAIANNQWLILVFHQIKDTPSTNPDDYQYARSKLNQIASYVKTKQDAGRIRAVKVSQALDMGATNILPNGGFQSGISGGWTTDNSASVVKDTNSKGAFPNQVDSIKFTGSAPGHLFSPKVPVTPGSKYGFKAFINTLGRKGGEFGFYIDEYDKDGNWISGQYYPVNNLVVSYFYMTYTPSSANVAKFKIQTFYSAGVSGAIFVDNYQLYNLTNTQGVTPLVNEPDVIATAALVEAPTATPTLTPTLTPSPTSILSVSPTATPSPTVLPNVNLVTNGSFETILNGWAESWEKDSDSFSIDTNISGNSGANSVKLVSNSALTHLFSSKINVENITYKWNQFIKVVSGSGEFGFYIDEYDSNGNWISGKWIGMINGVFSGAKEFSYTPTSSNVKSVRLQYYVLSGGTFNLFLDSVYFGK